jgi:hypothetical protein
LEPRGAVLELLDGTLLEFRVLGGEIVEFLADLVGIKGGASRFLVALFDESVAVEFLVARRWTSLSVLYIG